MSYTARSEHVLGLLPTLICLPLIVHAGCICTLLAFSAHLLLSSWILFVDCLCRLWQVNQEQRFSLPAPSLCVCV